MTLEDYVLLFKEASHKLNQPVLRGWAQSLYIGLGLDLPDIPNVRQEVLNDLENKKFHNYGLNVPEQFSNILREKVLKLKLPNSITQAAFNKLLIPLIDTAIEILKPELNDTPCCCSAHNSVKNKSNLPKKQKLVRYISLNTFESKLLFPNKQVAKHEKTARRIVYDNNVYVKRYNANVGIAVSLGASVTEIGKKRIPAPVFLCLKGEAPHEKTKKKDDSAQRIAAELGLPDWLKYESKGSIENEGIVALVYTPSEQNVFYRPTIFDALTHPAFRPGPSGEMQPYCYGMTRVCDPGETCWEDPSVTSKDGVKEVVMQNCPVMFPSNSLKLEKVVFYQ